MSGIKVLSVASEIFPLIKTGGLADVVGALPLALAPEGVEIRTLVPGYPAVLGALEGAQEVLAFPGLFGTARLLSASARGLNLFVLDAPYLYGRPGNPYTAPDGTDWPDNAYRFAALAKVAAEIGLGLLPAYQPEIVHMHDWQAGLTAAYMHYSGKAAPGTVMTVHNLAFQGQFPAELVMPLGLPPTSFAWDGVEHYGAVGFLKAGLQLADRITTVSPTYAIEIMQAETGMGFDGLLKVRADRVSGIRNGLDTAVWNPANDPHIVRTYDAAHLDARAANKVPLCKAFGLNPDPHALVVGVVSRLSWQKGLDLLLEVLPTLIAEGMHLAVVGAGEADLEANFLEAAEIYPGKIGVSIGYDETLAHRVQAGADALLVPSRYEPCGLTQLAALRYGAVPVVARVGGLSDTVIDANEMALASGAATGVQFHPVTSDSLTAALWRTARLYRDRSAWRTMQENGMRTDVSWRQPAQRYAGIYRELCGSKSGAAMSGGARGDAVTIAAPAPQNDNAKAVSAAVPATVDGRIEAASGGPAGRRNPESDGLAATGIEKNKPISMAPPAGEIGGVVVPLPGKANPDGAKGEVSVANADAFGIGKSVREAGKCTSVDANAPGSGNGAPVKAGAAGAAGEKGAPERTDAADFESYGTPAPLPQKPGPDSSSVAASFAPKSLGGGAPGAPAAERLSLEIEKGAVAFAGELSGESDTPVGPHAAKNDPEAGKVMAALPGWSAPENGTIAILHPLKGGGDSGEGIHPSSGMTSTGGKAKAANIEEDIAEGEADNTASIGWRDV